MPVATCTGWNFRNASIGGTNQLVTLLGSGIPFARTKAEREQAGDPRLSIEERYASVDDYLAKAAAVAEALVKGGYLLASDVPAVTRRIEAHRARTN